MLGVISSFIGQYGVAYILDKYKRQSVIIFMIAFILLISDIGLGVDGILSTISDVQVASAVVFCSCSDKVTSIHQDGKSSFGFRKLCSPSSP